MAGDRVLVVGGGISGLALGRALRRRGVPFTLVERHERAADAGLAINLPGNAVRAVAALGLREELEKAGRPTRRREYRSARGRLLFAVDEDAFWGPDARPRCVRRADLLALLEDGTEVSFRTVENVRADGTVTFEGGEQETYGMVVGADGVRSAVRAALFPGAGTRAALLSRASWRFMAPNPGVGCFTVWSGGAGAFLMIPVDGDQVYVFASATGGGPVAPDPAWLRAAFGDYPDPVRAVLDTPSEPHHSPIEEVRLDRWADGRCVLIGDAAHATAPVWAQGAALGMEDAVVLAGLLAEGDWDTVGTRFEARRRERVAHVQAVTDRFTKVAAMPIRLRNAVLPVMGPISYRGAFGPLRDGSVSG
ncbi:FAD-dependent monooxygenase [Actinoplanes sp. LDG1-06]|uniref:FAD-dependent monooxygenase n=1 Tax=Paractinoplanes ovalisporus TaxID=2810368 RepID=A0ABS2AGF8_9ACTN|nr:FAD-dependent monooxygenase [Actinoplanes ovalisporus]MBM2618458.1 FAD-dependent monooxygenase [Actinoplanes ovalisporus]